MLVTDIEIGNYSYCESSGRHLARVTMSLKNRSVTLFCRLDLPAGEPARRRAEAFVAEATRQLLRMPEFRSGANRLRFADGVQGGAQGGPARDRSARIA